MHISINIIRNNARVFTGRQSVRCTSWMCIISFDHGHPTDWLCIEWRKDMLWWQRGTEQVVPSHWTQFSITCALYRFAVVCFHKTLLLCYVMKKKKRKRCPLYVRTRTYPSPVHRPKSYIRMWVRVNACSTFIQFIANGIRLLEIETNFHPSEQRCFSRRLTRSSARRTEGTQWPREL